MPKLRKIEILFLGLALLWTGLVVVINNQEHRSERDLVVKLALAEARGNYNKDLVYRRWVAKQGGIYVKPSQFSPPNPYLLHIPDRDLKTISGQDLTLINPAYMTRQVHELAQDQYGAKGHITSLNPLRPENAPDPWEKDSLLLFQQGVKETTTQTTIAGEPYLRLMLPMVTETACLKCHGHQGYKVGDIRGGISVSIPLRDYFQAQAETLSRESENKLMLWFTGLVLVLLCYVLVYKYLKREQLIRQEVEQSEEKYRVLFDESTVGLALADSLTGTLVECNRKLLALVDRTQDEVRGKSQAILHSSVADSGTFTKEFLSHRDECPGSIIETTLLTRSGVHIPVEIKAQPVWINNKEMMLGIFHDLSERKAAEQQLVKNEKMLRAILNSQYDAVFLYRINAGSFGPFEMANEIAVKRYGYSLDSLLSLTLEDVTANGVCGKNLLTGILKSSKEQGNVTLVMSHIKKTGELFPVEISSTRLELDDNEYIVSVARDITERISLREQSQDLLLKLQHLSSQIPGMVYQFERSVSGTYSISYTSDAIRSLFELTPDEVKDNAEVLFQKVHPDDLPATLQSIQLSADQLSLWCHEFRVQKNNGDICWLEGNSIPKKQPDGRIVWYGHVSDISARKEEEQQQRHLLQQLRQREKINAVGMLASGISHNFNNHLAIILGNIDLAKRANVPMDERIFLLENAYIAANRASDMVRQIMGFSRQEEQEDSWVDLVQLLNETEKLLNATLPSAIQKTIGLPPVGSDLTVCANASRLQDILLNLCTNAVHAMNGRGCLTLSLARVAAEEIPVSAERDEASMDYACFSVMDTGCGIDEPLTQKIFDPFYTTKEIGQGTGLGLSTAKETVEHYGGAITVKSTPGEGTTFNVYLPLGISSSKKQEKVCDQQVPAGSERILLVDDEKMIVELNAEILKGLGYKVVLCTESTEAMEIFRNDPDAFDLVLTDQVMPSLTGLELAQKIKSLRPAVPIVLVTGYSLEVTAQTMRHFGITEMCCKPFEVADIAGVVRKALDGKNTD